MVVVREKRPSVGTRVAGVERGGRGLEPQRRRMVCVMGGDGLGLIDVVGDVVGGGCESVVVGAGVEVEKRDGNFGRVGFRVVSSGDGCVGEADAVVVLVSTRKWSDILVSLLKSISGLMRRSALRIDREWGLLTNLHRNRSLAAPDESRAEFSCCRESDTWIRDINAVSESLWK